MPTINSTPKFGLSQYTREDKASLLVNYTEDMRKIEEKALYKDDFVTSLTAPTNPTDGMEWLMPIGSLALTGEIVPIGGGQGVFLSGVAISGDPPEDKGKLWVKPSATI